MSLKSKSEVPKTCHGSGCGAIAISLFLLLLSFFFSVMVNPDPVRRRPRRQPLDGGSGGGIGDRPQGDMVGDSDDDEAEAVNRRDRHKYRVGTVFGWRGRGPRWHPLSVLRRVVAAGVVVECGVLLVSPHGLNHASDTELNLSPLGHHHAHPLGPAAMYAGVPPRHLPVLAVTVAVLAAMLASGVLELHSRAVTAVLALGWTMLWTAESVRGCACAPPPPRTLGSQDIMEAC